jgi:hypothetical protein
MVCVRKARGGAPWAYLFWIVLDRSDTVDVNFFMAACDWPTDGFAGRLITVTMLPSDRLGLCSSF